MRGRKGGAHCFFVRARSVSWAFCRETMRVTYRKCVPHSEDKASPVIRQHVVPPQRNKTLLPGVVGRQMCLGRTCKCEDMESENKHELFSAKVCTQLWRSHARFTHTHMLRIPQSPINTHVLSKVTDPLLHTHTPTLRDAPWPLLSGSPYAETLWTYTPPHMYSTCTVQPSNMRQSSVLSCLAHAW